MRDKFMIGDVVKINTPNFPEHAIIISEERYREISGDSEKKYELRSIFYQRNNQKVVACNPTFLKITNHIKKSSLKEAIFELETRKISLEESLEFFKRKE